MRDPRSPHSWLSPKAAPRASPIHGTGLFALAPIGAGEIVCVKGGHVFDRATLAILGDWFRAAEIAITEDLVIGPLAEEERTGSMLFTNHSCEPNIGIQGQIVFVALRDIAAGEELTHDWATTDDEDYRLECRCGAPTCRQIVTGKDWRRADLRAKYAGFFSWYLAERIRRGE